MLSLQDATVRQTDLTPHRTQVCWQYIGKPIIITVPCYYNCTMQEMSRAETGNLTCGGRHACLRKWYWGCDRRCLGKEEHLMPSEQHLKGLCMHCPCMLIGRTVERTAALKRRAMCEWGWNSRAGLWRTFSFMLRITVSVELLIPLCK